MNCLSLFDHFLGLALKGLTDDIADGRDRNNNRCSVKTGVNLKKKQENLMVGNERKINEKFQ